MDTAVTVDPRDAVLARALQLAPGEGFWIDLDEGTYHGLVDIWSRSQLEVLRQSPQRFQRMFMGALATRLRMPETKPFRVGRMLHCAVLEPDRWRRLYPDPPTIDGKRVDGRTKEGKAANAAWYADHPGAVLSKPGERELTVRMAEAVADDEWASPLCSEALGRREQSLIWRDRETGLLLRARPDVALDEPKAIDLKSLSGDPTPEHCAVHIIKYGYHRQAGMYLDGMEVVDGVRRRFADVFVSSKGDHEVATWEIEEPVIEMGRKEVRLLLRELAARLASDDPRWRASWQQGPKVLQFPGWVFRQSNVWMTEEDDDGE